MNTRSKSNIGLARAISYFSSHGYFIFLPMGDQGSPIDLAVSLDGTNLQRVQCKYTNAKHSASLMRRGIVVWEANLRVAKSRDNKIVITKYTADSFDLLFIATPQGDYLIDWPLHVKQLGKIPSTIIFGANMDGYKAA